MRFSPAAPTSSRWGALWPEGAMCTLTQRELDFLASLKTNWQRLYWREFVRILRENAQPRYAGAEAGSAPQQG